MRVRKIINDFLEVWKIYPVQRKGRLIINHNNNRHINNNLLLIQRIKFYFEQNCFDLYVYICLFVVESGKIRKLYIINLKISTKTWRNDVAIVRRVKRRIDIIECQFHPLWKLTSEPIVWVGGKERSSLEGRSMKEEMVARSVVSILVLKMYWNFKCRVYHGYEV